MILLLLWGWACREIASRAATGLVGSLPAGIFVPLVAASFLLFLLLLGFLAAERVLRQQQSLREILGLPRRPTARREWLLGSALGWGAVILSVIPFALRRALEIQTWFAWRGFVAALLSLLTILVATLATEVLFRGFPFRLLSASSGPNRAMVLLSLAYALSVGFASGRGIVVLIAFLFGLLLTVAWRRTHALWLSWGLHFTWNVALGVLFGLPLFQGTDLANVVQTQVRGGVHFSGNDLGPIAAPWTAIVLLGAVAVLVWLTRDLAWSYTHAPIIAAGYPMDVAPPAAHAAMEQSAPPPPLVQILPTTPQAGSRNGPLT